MYRVLAVPIDIHELIGKAVAEGLRKSSDQPPLDNTSIEMEAAQMLESAADSSTGPFAPVLLPDERLSVSR